MLFIKVLFFFSKHFLFFKEMHFSPFSVRLPNVPEARINWLFVLCQVRSTTVFRKY